jgi:hypothetical protein
MACLLAHGLLPLAPPRAGRPMHRMVAWPPRADKTATSYSPPENPNHSPLPRPALCFSSAAAWRRRLPRTCAAQQVAGDGGALPFFFSSSPLHQNPDGGAERQEERHPLGPLAGACVHLSVGTPLASGSGGGALCRQQPVNSRRWRRGAPTAHVLPTMPRLADARRDGEELARPLWWRSLPASPRPKTGDLFFAPFRFLF